MAREIPPAVDAADRGGGTLSKDDGLRRVLTWTAIALVASIVMALIGVTLAVRWFDH